MSLIQANHSPPTNSVMVHGMLPTWLSGSKWPKIKPTPNPVKRGYVDKPDYWKYSSDRDYIGLKGLMAVKPQKAATLFSEAANLKIIWFSGFVNIQIRTKNF